MEFRVEQKYVGIVSVWVDDGPEIQMTEEEFENWAADQEIALTSLKVFIGGKEMKPFPKERE